MRAFTVHQLSAITSRSRSSLHAAFRAGTMPGAFLHPAHGWCIPAENLDRVRFKVKQRDGLRFLRPAVVTSVLQELPSHVAEPLVVEGGRAAEVRCLRCESVFFSSDVTRHRICDPCHEAAAKSASESAARADKTAGVEAVRVDAGAAFLRKTYRRCAMSTSARVKLARAIRNREADK